MDKKNLLKTIAGVIFFIFLANFLAVKLYWYGAIWWFDMVMHSSGGLWLGLLFFHFFPNKNSLRMIGKALIFVFLMGAGWEIFEVIVNLFTINDKFDSLDTLSDLLFDVTGGMCAILYIWKKQSKLLSAAELAR